MIRPGPAEKIYPVAKIAVVVNALGAEGISPVRSLEGVDLSEVELHSPDTRVSINQVLECYHNAARLSRERNFAYHAGLRFHVSTYRMYGFAILSSTSFRQAVQFAVHYHQLETPVAALAFDEENDCGIWTITPAMLPQIDPTLYRFIVELQFGATISLHRDVMGPSFGPRELHVTYNAVQSMHDCENKFGCPMLFGQPENRIVFDREWLDRSPELGNELSYMEALRLCDQLLRNMEAQVGISGDVREILLRNIARNLTIDEVSKRLKLPVRSLKRKLQQQGTSYRRIVDQLKLQIAIKYLRETDLTVDDVAFCLGYSDAANFRQAFYRWTKVTPQQFRRNAQNAHAVGPKPPLVGPLAP